jgi:dipeptidyl aminopeptidase/acylaminoacyl peptidase
VQPFSIFLFSLLQAPILDVRNKHKAMMKIKSWLLAGCFVLGGAGHAETPMVAPPESLRIEGAPAIPESLADAIRPYGEYRSATIADWHPTERSLLISTRFADTPQLHRVSAPGAARRQLTFYRDAVRVGRYHPDGGDYIVFSRDAGGGEWYQLYRYEVATGNVTLLTDGKSRNTLGPFSSRGDRIAYTSTRRTGKDTDLWVMNPADPSSDRLLTALTGGGWEPLDWSPDDSKILLLEALSVNESYLWLVDTATGEKTAFTPRDAKTKISYWHGRFSKDGKGLYVTTDRDSEFHRLAYVSLASKQYAYLTSDIPWDVDVFDVSSDGTHIAFVANENGQSALYDFLTNLKSMQRVPGVPAGVIGTVRWHRNSRDLAFTLINAQDPGDAYSLDTATGKIERWTQSETEVPTQDFRPAELVKCKSFDGRTIAGFLYRPPARFTGKRPVLIGIHGGPEGQSETEFLGRLNYYLNELGIAYIEPNVRGSTGYGKSFALLDNGFLRENSYKDINALFDWIAAQPDLDSTRIAVMGGSYGGHATLAVSAFYSSRIRCAVDIVGMSNLVTFLEHTEGYRRDLRRAEYGDERDPKMRAFLERIAPMNNIEKIKKPILVIAGKNDPRVPESESDQIVTALQKQGTPVWYLLAGDEGHGYQKQPNRDYSSYVTLAFLRQYLLE